MTATPKLSDRSDNKLQAVLNHDWPDPADDLGADYRQSCAEWFRGLSESDKLIAAASAEAYASGRETAAEQIAAVLPPAPLCPLLHDDD